MMAKRVFSTQHMWAMNKMTLERLREKSLVGDKIKQVLIAFPDQYGRLWSTQVNAERFCAHHTEPFKFEGNPFSKDI
jgi:hypothetical protein